MFCFCVYGTIVMNRNGQTWIIAQFTLSMQWNELLLAKSRHTHTHTDLKTRIFIFFFIGNEAWHQHRHSKQKTPKWKKCRFGWDEISKNEILNRKKKPEKLSAMIRICTWSRLTHTHMRALTKTNYNHLCAYVLYDWSFIHFFFSVVGEAVKR